MSTMTTLKERIQETFDTARRYHGIGIAEKKVDNAKRMGLIPIEVTSRIVQGLWRLVKKNNGSNLTGRWK